MARIWQQWRDRLLAFIPQHLRAANVVLPSADASIHPQDIPQLLYQFAQTLPAELLAVFDDQPLPAGDPRFVGRKEAFEDVDAAIAAWQSHRPSLTAVVASHGAGLSSFLNQLRKKFPANAGITHFSLAVRPSTSESALSIVAKIFSLAPTPATVAQAISTINALAPTVLIIDDGHMLVSRQMGSQAGVQTLMAILVATQKRHCWILGCAKQAWRRLSYLHAMENFFGRVITLDYLDAEELGDAIERRLYGTGYQWAMRADLDLEKVDPLAVYTKKLHDLSFGHLPLAFFILQRALKVDAMLLHLDSFNTLDASILKACDMDEQFSLAEIYVHGALSESEHQAIFRLSAEQSLLRLERLRRMGLLFIIRTGEVESSNLYRLAPLMSHATVAHLINSNRLY